MTVDHLVLLVCKASPDLKVLLVSPVPRVNAVLTALRENRATLDLLVILVRVALLVCLVCLDLRVVVVKAVLRVTKV